MLAKHILLLLATSCLLNAARAQTLFTYGKHKVSKQEFLNAWKNSFSSADTQNDLKASLDLYVRYQLKVQAAKDLKMDTFLAFRADVENYKRILQEEHLTDRRSIDSLVDQAVARSQKEIEVRCYYIPLVKADDSPKSEKTIRLLYDRLRAGTFNDSSFAEETGIFPELIDGGFITVFSLPYTFENAVYSLAPGEISLPFKNENGWYVFQNVSERKSVGKLTVAQILIYSQSNNNTHHRKAKLLADSLFRLLENGADFGELARTYSDDRSSFLNEGILEPFGTGKYDPGFAQKAFSIKADGITLPPFQTELGYHIIRRISLQPVPPLSDEGFVAETRQKVLQDERIEVAHDVFREKVSLATGATISKFFREDLWKITDTAIYARRNIPAGKLSPKSTLISFNNHASANVNDWLMFASAHLTDVKPNSHHYEQMFRDFVQHCAEKNYRERMEDFDSSYKQKLKEYVEGNLLFAIMQKKVWGKTIDGADGAKIAAFQDELEEQWVAELKEKYPVKIDKDVLKSL